MKYFYAIGDIHGCLDELRALVQMIENDNVTSKKTIIFLGDYVDRGPDSKGVIEFLMAGPKSENDTWLFLKGNHEDLMLGYHGTGNWVKNGGVNTLESYNDEIIKEHLDWIDSLPSIIELDNHICVHAGLNPNIENTADQSDAAVLWIRGAFLRMNRSVWNGGKHIIHGHTPTPIPDMRDWRTGLDTGCVFGGPLTAGLFDSEVREGPIKVHQVQKVNDKLIEKTTYTN